MMSLSTIHELSREAAEQAAEEGRVPFVFEKQDVEDFQAGRIDNINIPNLGDHLPNGWNRVDLSDWDQHGIYMGDADGFGTLFVDKQGWGAPGEAAMTREEFAQAVRPGYGYAMVEKGQFQVKVGVFEKAKA